MDSLSSQCVGFVGTGKISSCLVRGFAGAGAPSRPRRILVSPRNEDKARALATEFPGLVEIARDNAQVVSESDVVFIGLLPAIARSELPTLPFGGAEGGKLVVSMMAAVDIEEMKSLTGVSADRIVRTVPLPSSARREGPILVHPKLPRFDELLSVVGTPVGCATEEEMKPLICLTGHISSFFELMRTTQAFMESEGVDQATARLYVSSFYSSLARATELSGESLADMAVEARTPGGINEQCMRILGAPPSQHFSMQQQSLAAILRRLRGQEVYVPLSASAPAESEGER